MKDQALTMMPHEDELIQLVKMVFWQESQHKATAIAERQEAMTQSFQCLSQEVQSDSQAWALKE